MHTTGGTNDLYPRLLESGIFENVMAAGGRPRVVFHSEQRGALFLKEGASSVDPAKIGANREPDDNEIGMQEAIEEKQAPGGASAPESYAQVLIMPSSI